MKKTSVLVLILIFTITGNVFAASKLKLTPKENNLLRSHIIFIEDYTITKIGNIEVYSREEKETSGYDFKTYRGCIPVETNFGGTKESFFRFFEFSVGDNIKEDQILTIYKEKVFPKKSLNSCPSKEKFDKILKKNNKKNLVTP